MTVSGELSSPTNFRNNSNEATRALAPETAPAPLFNNDIQPTGDSKNVVEYKPIKNFFFNAEMKLLDLELFLDNTPSPLIMPLSPLIGSNI